MRQIGVADISRSVEDYARRLGCSPSVVVPDEYALWRMPSINLLNRRRVACQLRERFSSVRVFRIWLSGPWAMFIKRAEESHSAVLGRSRHGRGEWVLVVAPARTAGLFDRVFRASMACCMRKLAAHLLPSIHPK